jgi:cytochrome P450
MTDSQEQYLGAYFAQDSRPDPYPLLNKIREQTPIFAMDGNLVILGKHADCDLVLRHPAASVNREKSRIASARGREKALSFLDPPDHTRLRRLISKAFTPRVVAQLEPRIREFVDEKFDELAGCDGADFARHIAYPLPLTIISEMLGLSIDDGNLYEAWTRRIVRNVDPTHPGRDPEDGEAARDEFRDYFRKVIAVRDPSEDTLLNRLVDAHDGGDTLTEDELLTTLVLLVVAGHDTTAITITNGILALLRNPDQLDLLRADPSLAENAVEEVLRYDPPVHLSQRVLAGEVRVGEHTLAEGADVVFLLAAANRDPEACPDPDRFDIRRGVVNHLAFSAGIHYCLGNSLAKLQAAIVLEAFAKRVQGPKLVEESLVYRPHINLRGLEQLELSFTSVSPR